MAEGVGFEPTVGYPTLDFESSALNRTQPPFPFRKAPVPGADYQLRVYYCKHCKLRSRTNGGVPRKQQTSNLVMTGGDLLPGGLRKTGLEKCYNFRLA